MVVTTCERRVGIEETSTSPLPALGRIRPRDNDRFMVQPHLFFKKTTAATYIVLAEARMEMIDLVTCASCSVRACNAWMCAKVLLVMIGDAGMCAWEGDVVGAGMRE